MMLLKLGAWFELDVWTGLRGVYLRVGRRDWWLFERGQ